MVNMAVSCPLHIFPRKLKLLSLTLGDERALPPRPGIYPQNLSIIYTALNYKGFWKTAKERVGLLKTKGETFLVSQKLRAIWGNLTLYHPSLPLSKKTFLFPSFWPGKKYTWHLFEKKLSDLF